MAFHHRGLSLTGAKAEFSQPIEDAASVRHTVPTW
jgi:hypothetical protein